jgi:hydroxymethylbilane synthase
MGGSCSMPLAAHATLSNSQLNIQAAWGNPEDLHAPLIRAQAQGDVITLAQAEQLGLQVATQLRTQGAA